MFIEEKIQNLWSSRSRRDAPHSREHKDEYHMDSHEGPLITIGFLTFAVYLIKLVLVSKQTIIDNLHELKQILSIELLKCFNCFILAIT